MSQITISLCLIVKNEEDVVERCIKSVIEAVDEIIIVDTGSIDDTKKIVKNLGGILFDFKWRDDFSAARNYAFSKATKEYILWLDADDVIPEQSLNKLIKLKNNFDNSINYVTMNYILAQDPYGNTTCSLRRNRLVKRECNFRWIGEVHEYLEVISPGINVDIDVIHKKEKKINDRNLKIFQKMIDNKKILSDREIFYYGNELYNNNLIDEAISQYIKFLQLESGWVEDKKTACRNLAQCYILKEDKDNALRAAFKSFEFDTPRADFCCIIGDILMEREAVDAAVFWYEVAAKWAPPEGYLAVMESAYYTWIPHLQLCVAYFKKGDLEKSMYHNEEAGKYIPYNPKIDFNRNIFQKIKELQKM